MRTWYTWLPVNDQPPHSALIVWLNGCMGLMIEFYFIKMRFYLMNNLMWERLLKNEVTR